MSNVFGTVIDDAYVKRLPDYYLHKGVITAKDRADLALAQQYTRGNNTEASNYVKQLKDQTDVDYCTLVVLYNATGNPIEYAIDHDWYGKIGSAPYPQRLGNGQWAGFLHQKTPFATSGSNGAVVYHCIDANGEISDTVLAWDTPWAVWSSNKAYTEVCQKDHYKDENDCWDVLNDKMYNGDYTKNDKRNGLESKVSTASGDKPEYVATLSLI